jgi:thiol-disulfide isomerase/thioredoxin/outer membrane lipoprotein-sorting protein
MLRKLTLRSALALVLAFAVAPVWGAPDPALSAQQILAKTAETYRGVTAYAWHGEVATHMTVQGKEQDVANDIAAYYGGPGRARFESQANGSETLFLQSGDSVWSYAGSLGQYTVAAAASNRPTSPIPGLDPFAAHPLAGYARIADGVKTARRLDDDARVVDGHSVPVYVVEVRYDTTVVNPDSLSTVSPKRYWIDRARFLVLADSLALERRSPALPDPVKIAQRSSLNHVEWNTPPADSLFAFQAPAGAERVAELGRAGGGTGASGASAKDPFVGQVMPEFALKDLGGVTRPLSASRGKVVLLDFWATWCGPCRREMPTIQKLHRRYGSKGLAVWGVNCSEPKVAVSQFVRSNRYTIPMLLDQDGTVQNKFRVDGIPTLFVLDAKGTIVAHLVGMRDEDELLDALKRAGLATGP